MDKIHFKNFCKIIFEKNGFKKNKNIYQIIGEEVYCGIFLQKSNFGDAYYINYFFCIGNYINSAILPTYYESDVDGRIHVISKTQFEEESVVTTAIKYEEYSEDELFKFVEEEINKKLLPPIFEGKKYILDNLNKLYFLTLNQDEVMGKLQS